MTAFSILIPTFQRKDKLRVVLEAVFQQESIAQGEIVVGIDGSEDGTREMLEEMMPNIPVPLRFFWIPNSGRSVIRNRLLEEARSELLIYIQDDIVVTSGWLQAHLDFHARRSGALVGHMTWYPHQIVSPYMQWLESGGHMLDFRGFRDGDQMDFWHFYMGNISFPKSLIGDLRFDESQRGYGWEDIVFGYRVSLRGGQVFYSTRALAYHWDEYLERDLPAYMLQVGQSAVLCERRFPSLGLVPPWWKQLVFRCIIIGSLPFRSLLPHRWRWYLEMKRWFLEGVDRTLRMDTPPTL